MKCRHGKKDGFYGIRQRRPKPPEEYHCPARSDLVRSRFLNMAIYALLGLVRYGSLDVRPELYRGIGSSLPLRLPDDGEGNESIERIATFSMMQYCSTNILDPRLEYSSRGADLCTSKKCMFIFCCYWYSCCGCFSGRYLHNERRGVLWDEI